MLNITEKKTRDLNRLAGKWVALVDSEVVEDADSLPKLMLKIKSRKFAKKPSVMLMPRKDEGPYILVFLS